MTTNAVTLTSPQELLALVPYLLGFSPSRSVMLLCLRDRRLGLIQRLDLPRPEHAQDVVSALLPALVKEDPDAVILLGFEDQEDESLPALEALTAAMHSQGLRVHDRLVVRAGIWRSMDCSNSRCCPTEGSPVPKPADVSRVAAEFVGQGVAPHPDRDSLAQQVEAGPQAEAVTKAMRSLQESMVDADEHWSIARAELFEAWLRILDTGASAISVEDAALAAVSLLDIEVRDGLWPGSAPAHSAWMSSALRSRTCSAASIMAWVILKHGSSLDCVGGSLALAIP